MPNPIGFSSSGSCGLRVFLLAAGVGLLSACSEAPAPGASAVAPAGAGVRPALSVKVALPQSEEWPQVLAIDGNVMAWQEAVIGAEIGQQRIAEVAVQVGDRVKKGQLLARIDEAAVAAELAEARAAVAELEAAASEAKSNAERADALRGQGFYSPQMQNQYATAERTAAARLLAARARLQSAQLRMSRTRVLAPDDGVISARAATVGSLSQPGQELFRLIRGGRLEWQAEVSAVHLAAVKPGAVARLIPAVGTHVEARVRSVAPSVDPRSRNGIVYVDLPVQPAGTEGLRAGMFARGEILTGQAAALTVPQAALVMRDGHAHVYRVLAGEGGQRRVELLRVKTGRRQAERVEIIEGLTPDTQVVVVGAGFLADGDVVSVAAEAAPAASSAEAAVARSAP